MVFTLLARRYAVTSMDPIELDTVVNVQVLYSLGMSQLFNVLKITLA